MLWDVAPPNFFLIKKRNPWINLFFVLQFLYVQNHVLYTSSKDVVSLQPFYLNTCLCLFYTITFLGYIELVLQPLDFQCLVRG